MLLCTLPDLSDGLVVAAPVVHPQRPEVELLSPGVKLEPSIIARLKQLGVASLWVHHDATADLDHLVAPNLSAVRRAAYERLRQDFGDVQTNTVSTASIQAYRGVVIELVCELVGNRHLAGLTDQLFGGPANLFTHGANVAMLALIAGLELETYVVQQRSRIAADRARDLTSLGIGAMLHDIGKVALPEGLRDRHAGDPWPEGSDEAEALYREHPQQGYMMLRDCRAPAPATQVVLTHHQRFDGQGFPDMTQASGKRRRGPQSGCDIHIFSRLVAVADMLDALLGHGTDRRPPVMALHALAGERFDGWFDPLVRDRVLRVMPPFPIGSLVRLSDGRPAVVMTPNLVQPCRPTVRLLSEADRLPDGRYPLVDLGEAPLHVAEAGGRDISAYLFELGQPLQWQRAATQAA